MKLSFGILRDYSGTPFLTSKLLLYHGAIDWPLRRGFNFFGEYAYRANDFSWPRDVEHKDKTAYLFGIRYKSETKGGRWTLQADYRRYGGVFNYYAGHDGPVYFSQEFMETRFNVLRNYFAYPGPVTGYSLFVDFEQSIFGPLFLRGMVEWVVRCWQKDLRWYNWGKDEPSRFYDFSVGIKLSDFVCATGAITNKILNESGWRYKFGGESLDSFHDSNTTLYRGKIEFVF